MSTSLPSHYTLLPIIVTGALAFTACGGPTAPRVATPAAVTTPSASTVGGATGVPGLDWGASADAVKAAYPMATVRPEGGLWSMGMAENMTALTSFRIGASGLEQINIEWTEGFISMDDCATHWKTLRDTYNGRFGASQSDNLAAYWKTATANITLACNPNESNAGVLTMHYDKPDAQ